MKEGFIIMENKLYEQVMKYDEKGNLIYSKNNVGNEKIAEYNENGNPIYTKLTNIFLLLIT